MQPINVPSKTQLVTQAYATDQPLRVRIETHQRYSEPPLDWSHWVLDQHRWRGDETILDVGTGSGQYLAPLRACAPHGLIIGSDLAWGMLRDLRAQSILGQAALLNSDVELLPLADAVVDVVLASYVLFFVPDIPRALLEIKRVLKPGGTLLAVTMADVYMDELRTAVNAALHTLGAKQATTWGNIQRRFSLTTGLDYLAPHFQTVCYQHQAALVFPQAAPVLAYVNSIRDTLEADVPAAHTWDDLLAALETVVNHVIAKRGEFRVAKPAGVLVAVKPI